MASEKITENFSDKRKRKIEYDDLLSAAGELGCYQWTLFMSLFPFYAFGVFVYYSQMFITEVSPNHWCRIPELENMSDIQRRDLGIPKDNISRFRYSQCEMYVADWANVLATGQKPNHTWLTVPCQYGWEFNKSEIPYPTIGSDFEWVCEKNSYQATAQSIFFVGSIFGGLIFGIVADRFGRLLAITTSCLVGCIGGFTSTFARNLAEFSAARFVLGTSYSTCMMMAYLLILEYVAPKHRTLLANMSFALFYCLFVVVLPWIALACGHWQTTTLVTSLPLLLGVLTKFFIPESPRWLLTKGRVDEAVEKVLIIGRINKKEVPACMIEEFKSSLIHTKEEHKYSFLEVITRPILRKMFILICLEYMFCSLVFDGLVRSIGQLDYDFFISFSVISFTEFPSVILVAFIMDYFGRRWLCIVSMAISCIFCILTIFASGIQTVVLSFIARFAINIGLSAVMQWAPEILPAPVRGSGVAVVNVFGCIGSFLSPYIIYLKEYIYWLPFAVLGVISSMVMLIALAIPETAMKCLPQTFDESEELAKNQCLWTLPFLESRKRIKKEQERQVSDGFQLESSLERVSLLNTSLLYKERVFGRLHHTDQACRDFFSSFSYLIDMTSA